MGVSTYQEMIDFLSKAVKDVIVDSLVFNGCMSSVESIDFVYTYAKSCAHWGRLLLGEEDA